MDLRKLKTLIDLVSESNISELEITEAEGKVRIVKGVTTFIMWLVYIGYLSLRAAIAEPATRARVSAVYGIIGFVTMPMSLLSSRICPLLRSSHPKVIASSSGGLSPEAGIAIGVTVIAFTVLFAAMLLRRVELEESEEELEELKRMAGGEE